MRIWKWGKPKNGKGSGSSASKVRKRENSCPSCHSTKVVKISYGLMMYDEDLERDIAEGRVRIGGCSIGPDSPTYCCVSCECRW